jgi:hypothetical protein
LHLPSTTSPTLLTPLKDFYLTSEDGLWSLMIKSSKHEQTKFPLTEDCYRTPIAHILNDCIS